MASRLTVATTLDSHPVVYTDAVLHCPYCHSEIALAESIKPEPKESQEDLL